MKEYGGTVAIVGIGGMFPDASDLTSFWNNIKTGRSSFREVPDGRWAVATDAVFASQSGTTDCVYSRIGCFINDLPSATSLPGLAIDGALLEGLDPLFHLLIHAGKRAF
ncbi:MAG: beta-ketoacyl synthase N-terminal-like domain-containing protein, partial [Desulfuromonadaceae bacterium]|nr:beta-ketoacyl synthase N-terminal-like domain-containing protein [Desulfuromonadaceae bacterium]